MKCVENLALSYRFPTCMKSKILSRVYINPLRAQKVCVWALSRNGRLFTHVHFEKKDFKVFQCICNTLYQLCGGMSNLPFLFRVHTCF